MITLITGVPGAGKTAYVVGELMKQTRPLFVMGIPELTLDHEPVPPVADWTCKQVVPEDPTITETVFTFPPNALVVIDECQKILRPRAAGSKVPPYVEAYERHRHQGLDFWLLTQHPNLIDTNVRRLVGRHIHLRVTWAGRKLFEWPEVVSPDDRASLSRAITRPYTLPREAFSKYKSAELHTKPERRKPWQLWALLALIAVGGLVAWRVGGTIRDAATGEGDGSGIGAVAPESNADPGVSSGGPAPPVTGASVDDYRPRLPQRPETAPLYDGIREPRAMPKVAGCVALPARCECFTQQGTPAFLSAEQCQAWLASPPFDPWREPPAVARSHQKEGGAEKPRARSDRGSELRPIPAGLPAGWSARRAVGG